MGKKCPWERVSEGFPQEWRWVYWVHIMEGIPKRETWKKTVVYRSAVIVYQCTIRCRIMFTESLCIKQWKDSKSLSMGIKEK